MNYYAAEDKAKGEFGALVFVLSLIVLFGCLIFYNFDVFGDRAAKERSEIIDRCTILTESLGNQLPQDVADKCQRILQEEKQAKSSKQHRQLKSDYQRIIDY